LTISYLAPEQATINVTGASEAAVSASLLETLDQVKELQILSVKDLGEAPDQIPTPSTTTLN
jgi:hypothetical protein